MSEDQGSTAGETLEEDEAKTKKGKVPKATKAQLDAVKRTANEVVELLDREQEVSISSLAQALDEINEGEALAHLDTRLAFLERQVERLLSRREEADRGFQAELNVMRARLEDALSAVGSTSSEQGAAIAALESRIAERFSSTGHESASVMDSVRSELVEMVSDATAKLEKAEARLRGEVKAVEDLAEERTKAVTASLAGSEELRDEIKRELDAGMIGLNDRFAQAEQSVAAVIESSEAKVAELTSLMESSIARIDEAFEKRMEAERELLDQRLDVHSEELSSKIETEAGKMSSHVESERREIEARLGEASADLRLEIHQLRSTLDEAGAAAQGLFDRSREEAVARIQESEKRSAGAAIHLESVINQWKRQTKSLEEETSSAIGSLAQDLNAVKLRIEEVAAKFDSVEARRVSDRSAAESAAQSMLAKVDLMDTRLKEVVEEVMAKQATRMEVLASQVANITRSDVAAEERSGAVDYLARRLAETSERIDELSARVSSMGRAPAGRQAPGQAQTPAVPDDLAQRLAVLENRMLAISHKPRQDAVTEGLAARLGAIERKMGDLTNGTQQGIDNELSVRIDELTALVHQLAGRTRQDPAGELGGRLESLERAVSGMPATFSARQSEISGRIEELERKVALAAPNIIPDRKRRGLI